MKNFIFCTVTIATMATASVVSLPAVAQPAKAAAVAAAPALSTPAPATVAASPDSGTTREDIIKSQLKFQTESTKKIAQMAERLEQIKTIQSMNQLQLEALKKQLQTDLDKANKILTAAAAARVRDKAMDELAVTLEGWVKMSTKSLASVSKLIDARMAASVKKPA